MKRKKRKIFVLIERLLIALTVILITAVIVRATDKKINISDQNKADNNGCAGDMVFVTAPGGGFCIDKYEVSPTEECPYSNPASADQTMFNIDYPDCQPVSQPNVLPWRFISQNQAALACAKTGKRLPTNKEWLRAALGTPDKEAGWGAADCQVAKNWSTQPGLTGSGRDCVSSAGAYDLIGNVWEWVDGTIYDGKYQEIKLPAEGYIMGVDENGLPSATNSEKLNASYYYDYFWVKDTETRSLARGGYWDSQAEAGQYSLYAVVPPSFIGPGIGFRCAK
jgi:formylglycine-generating enzyme required for sulfatase activity